MLEDVLLGEGSREIADKDISLRVGLVIDLLEGNCDNLVFNHRIVEDFLALDCGILSNELSVAIVKRLVSLLVNNDDGLDDLESLLLNHLVQIEVVELGGQVTDVQGGKSFLFVLLLILLAGIRGGALVGASHQCLHRVDQHHLVVGDAGAKVLSVGCEGLLGHAVGVVSLLLHCGVLLVLVLVLGLALVTDLRGDLLVGDMLVHD